MDDLLPALEAAFESAGIPKRGAALGPLPSAIVTA